MFSLILKLHKFIQNSTYCVLKQTEKSIASDCFQSSVFCAFLSIFLILL